MDSKDDRTAAMSGTFAALYGGLRGGGKTVMKEIKARRDINKMMNIPYWIQVQNSGKDSPRKKK